jgi:hypothetical protein
MLYKRDLMLGGNNPCTDVANNATGPNDGGLGWWNFSLFIDVANGIVQQRTATRNLPFFEGGCAATTKHAPTDDGCAGICLGVPTVQPANNLAYPRGIHYLTFDKPTGGQGTINLREGVDFHLARVTQTRSDNGFICRVQLVGNDGGMGGSCSPCQSFSYGHNMRAIGVDPSFDLGVDLSGKQDNGQVSYSVGELVVVIGFSPSVFQPCDFLPGDQVLIVTRTTGGHGENFRNLYWQQFRCPGFSTVDRFFDGVEDAFRQRSACDGPALGVDCACVSGYLQCVE